MDPTFETSSLEDSSATKSWYDMVLEEEDRQETDLQIPDSTYPITSSYSSETPRPTVLDFDYRSFSQELQPLTSTPRRSHPNRSRNHRNSPSPSSRREHHKENISPVSSREVTPHGVHGPRCNQRRRRSNQAQSATDAITSRPGSRSPIRRPLSERQTPTSERKSWSDLISGRSPRSPATSTASAASPSASSPASLERDLQKDFCDVAPSPSSEKKDLFNDTDIDLDLSCGFDDSMCLTEDTAPISDRSSQVLRTTPAPLKRTLSVDSRDEFASRPSKRPCYAPTMSDPHRLSQRQKQIDFGKKTTGYDIYVKTVPRSDRAKGMPRTPEKRLNCSKRQFDGLLRCWRKKLHAFDPESARSPSCSMDDMSDSALGISVATDIDDELASPLFTDATVLPGNCQTVIAYDHLDAVPPSLLC